MTAEQALTNSNVIHMIDLSYRQLLFGANKNNLFSHGTDEKPFGERGEAVWRTKVFQNRRNTFYFAPNRKSDKNRTFPPFPYGFLLRLLSHVAHSCATSCRTLGQLRKRPVCALSLFPPCPVFHGYRLKRTINGEGALPTSFSPITTDRLFCEQSRYIC